jgi:hypothetical protein
MTYELSSFHRKSYGDWAGNRKGVKPDPSRCCAEVSAGWHYSQCSRKRGYGPEEAYCKTHDPVVKKQKLEAERAAYLVKQSAENEKWKLKANAQNFLDALRLIADGHNDPRSLAIEAIKDFPTPYSRGR